MFNCEKKTIKQQFQGLKKMALLNHVQRLQYKTWKGRKVTHEKLNSIKDFFQKLFAHFKDVFHAKPTPCDATEIPNKVEKLITALNDNETDQPEFGVSWLEKIEQVVNIAQKNFVGMDRETISKLRKRLNNTVELHAVLRIGSEGKAKALELIKKGVIVHAKSSKGLTLLQQAFVNSWSEVIVALIEQGADLKVKAARGQTLLQQALYSSLFNSIREEVALALIKKGVDVSVKDSYGQTLLQQAFVKGWKKVALALIQKGADVSVKGFYNVKGSYGRTLLEHALEMRWKKVALALIQKGADINAKPTDGTHLGIAFTQGLHDLALEMIKKGADVNVKGSYGRTPLEAAIRNDWEDVAVVLIEKGADIDTKNDRGKTLLQQALIKNHGDIALALIHRNSLDTLGDPQLAYYAGGLGKLDSPVAKKLLEYSTDKKDFQSKFVSGVIEFALKRCIKKQKAQEAESLVTTWANSTQAETFFTMALREPTVGRYLLETHPNILDNLLKTPEFAPDKLSFSMKLALLPSLPPVMIRDMANRDKSVSVNDMLHVGGRSLEGEEALLYSIKNKITPSVPFSILPAVMKDPSVQSTFVKYFSTLSPAYQRVVLPLLPPDQAGQLLFKHWEQCPDYVAMATPQQKLKFFEDLFEKCEDLISKSFVSSQIFTEK